MLGMSFEKEKEVDLSQRTTRDYSEELLDYL